MGLVQPGEVGVILHCPRPNGRDGIVKCDAQIMALVCFNLIFQVSVTFEHIILNEKMQIFIGFRATLGWGRGW